MNGFPSIPASPAFLVQLLGVVFVLHVLLVNYVVGGPLVSAWYLITKGKRGRQRAKWLLSAVSLPLTLAVCFGIAALLVNQALYGEALLTANVFMTPTSLPLIALLVAAYCGIHGVNRLVGHSRRSPRWIGFVVLAVAATVAAMGLIMIVNYFITAHDERWRALVTSPWVVLKSSDFAPRGLHFVFGSFAVTGFWMMWISWWRSSRGENHYDVVKLFKQGAALASGATAVQIVQGVWFVLSLHPGQWDQLFSGSLASTVWTAGVAASLLLLGSLLIVNFTLGRFFWLKVSTGLLLLTLIGMSAGREMLRPGAQEVSQGLTVTAAPPSQDGMHLFFVAAILAGVAAGLVIRVAWRLPRSPFEA